MNGVIVLDPLLSTAKADHIVTLWLRPAAPIARPSGADLGRLLIDEFIRFPAPAPASL